MSVVGACVFLVILLCQRFTLFSRTRYSFFLLLAVFLIFIIPLHPIRSGVIVNLDAATLDQIPPIDLYEILTNCYVTIVWLAGALAFILTVLITSYVFRRKINKDLRPANQEMQDIFNKVCQDNGMTGKAVLTTSSIVQAPVGIGLIRPMIILPDTLDDPFDIELILRHEITHYKHRDHWTKLFANIILALHWFNPAAHILLRRFVESIEVRCDEYAVGELPPEEREYYCEMLIRMAHDTSRRSTYALHNNFAQSEDIFKQRIECVMLKGGDTEKKRKKLASRILATVILPVALLLSAFAFRLTEEKIYLIDPGQGEVVDYMEVDTPEEDPESEGLTNLSQDSVTFTIDAEYEGIQELEAGIVTETGSMCVEATALTESDFEVIVYGFTTEDYSEVVLQENLNDKTQEVVLSDLIANQIYYLVFEIVQAQENIEIVISDTGG